MNNENFQMYQNTGYTNPRNRKRTLTLDVDDSSTLDTHLGAGSEFKVELFEPLRIDKHSEIYLDNFLTYNSNIANQMNNSAFLLKINEFNMNSNVASSTNGNSIFNSLVIPNEHKSVSGNHNVVVHKGKKFNYICDINPQTISSLSGTITNLAGDPMFHGPSTTAGYTYALTGIASMAAVAGLSEPMFPLLAAEHNLQADRITTITIDGDSDSPFTVDGDILAHTQGGADTIHFSSDTDLDVSKFHSAGGTNITFTLNYRDDSSDRSGDGGGQLQFVNASNPNLQLIKSSGRFIAEFSIITRE